MRILVLGGRGFLGRRVTAALATLDDVEAVPASRSAGDGCVVCDITDSASRPAMDGFDVVVDCVDGRVASPVKAAEYCLLSGKTFVETSADVAVVEGLWHAARAVPEPSGAVLLGAGLFPGLSNLLAADLAARADGRLRSVEVGVRYSPLTQAGSGVCDLITAALARPALRYVDGARVEDPPLMVGGRFPFASREPAVLGVGLPEALMLHWSTAVPTTGAVLAARPGLPVTVQRVLTLFAPWVVLRWAPLRWLAARSLWLLRGGLLRWRAAEVELAAVGDRGLAGAPPPAWLRVQDGFSAAAWAVAAKVSLLRESTPLGPGVHLVDQCFQLHPVLERMRALGGSELRLELADRPRG